MTTHSSNRHDRRSRSTILLAGWLFADVLLALAVIFLAVSSDDPSALAAPTEDTIGPVSVEILRPADGALTRSRRLAVVGSATPKTLVVVELDGEPMCEAVSSADGDWSCVVEGLSEGEHTIAAGHGGMEARRQFTVDLSDPQLTLDPPGRLSRSELQSFVLSGTCSEHGEDVLLRVGGLERATVCDQGRFEASDLDLLPIFDELMVEAIHADAAGNTTRARTSSLWERVGIELEPVSVTIRVGSRADTLERLLVALSELPDRRAGLVLSFGGGSAPGSGVQLSGFVNDLLAEADPTMFAGAVTRDFWRRRSRGKRSANGDLLLHGLTGTSRLGIRCQLDLFAYAAAPS